MNEIAGINHKIDQSILELKSVSAVDEGTFKESVAQFEKSLSQIDNDFQSQLGDLKASLEKKFTSSLDDKIENLRKKINDGNKEYSSKIANK